MTSRGDEVVVEPARLDDYAVGVRRRVLRVDVDDYGHALRDYLHAPSDLPRGLGLHDLSHRVEQVLADVEQLNRSAEAFADAAVTLDRARVRQGVVTASLSVATFRRLRQRWARLAATDLVLAADALRTTRALAAELAAASTGELGGPASGDVDGDVVDAAANRISALLADLVDLGVGDDPALQAAVVAELGPDGTTAFATALANLDAAAPGDTPWVEAAMVTLARWTSAGVAAMDDRELAAFVDAVPAALVGALNLLVPWTATAGVVAAASVWDRSAPDTTFRMPDGMRPDDWGAAGGDRELAATMLAANPGAAHRLVTTRMDVLAGLVSDVDHPAAADAVRAGLVGWPRSQWSRSGEVSAVRASAQAFARLMDRDATLGQGSLTTGGHATLERVAGFHLDLVDRGVVASASAFLGGATGTHGPLVDTFLHRELETRPGAARAIAARMDTDQLRVLTATLADPDVAAVDALARVGREVTHRLERADDARSRALLDGLGHQAVADLAQGAAAVADTTRLRRMATAVVATIGRMDVSRRVEWFALLGLANDRAGIVPLLLAGAADPPTTVLPVLLASEGSGILVPRSDEVVDAVHELTGDWRTWSRDIYLDLLERHPAPSSVMVDAVSGWERDTRLRAAVTGTIGVDGPARAWSSTSTTEGLADAISSRVIDHPEFWDAPTGAIRAMSESADETVIGLMGMVRRTADVDRAVDAYVRRSLATAGRDGPDGRDDEQDDWQLAGFRIGALRAAAIPVHGHVDRGGMAGDAAVTALSTLGGPVVDAADILVSNVSVHGPDFNASVAQRRQILARVAPSVLATFDDGHEVLRALGFRRDGQAWTPPADGVDAHRAKLDHPEHADEIDVVVDFVDGLAAGVAAGSPH